MKRRIATYNSWHIIDYVDGFWKIPRRVIQNGPNEDSGLVHSLEKWNLGCKGRGCRCNRSGRYKYRESVGRKRKYRRKGWNKIQREIHRRYFETEFERWIAEDVEKREVDRMLQEISKLSKQIEIRLWPGDIP